jgi:hypothetical protein
MATQYGSAAVNVPRDGHYQKHPVTGLYERTLLLEASRVNALLYSRDLSNAAWALPVAATGSVALNAAGIDGTPNTASTLTDTDATASYGRYQSVVVANDNASHTAQFWIAKDAITARFVGCEADLTGGTTIKAHQVHLNTATGAITTAATIGGGGTARAWSVGSWWVVEIVLINNTTGNVSFIAAVYPALGTVFGTVATAAMGSCVVGHVQAERTSAFGSSPILTAAATVTRSADVLSLPFPFAPLEMTLYVRFYERGTVVSGGAAAIATVSDGSGTAPALYLRSNGTGGGYVCSHLNGVGTVTTTAVGAAALDALVELRAVLNVDGSVLLGASVNGAAESVTAATAALALASAWSAATLQLTNSLGYSGFMALTHVKALRGVRTLAEMRAA